MNLSLLALNESELTKTTLLLIVIDVGTQIASVEYAYSRLLESDLRLAYCLEGEKNQSFHHHFIIQRTTLKLQNHEGLVCVKTGHPGPLLRG